MSFRRRICGGVTFPREGPWCLKVAMYSTRDRPAAMGRTERSKFFDRLSGGIVQGWIRSYSTLFTYFFSAGARCLG